jgi:anthranilate synthase/aminodeoxychorismate synthase-like glutamine amidotransferase
MKFSMLLVIDNYDSFTYNLVQYCAELGADVQVLRNSVSLDTLRSVDPTALLISPGPCTPSDAGCSIAAIQYFSGRIPVLGVCLGHQSLAQAFGGQVVRSSQLMHGKTSLVRHFGDAIFSGVPERFRATRYHSLVVDPDSLPDAFDSIAETEDALMGIRHRPTGAIGLQFHPESILTEHGKTMLQNFLAS